MAMLYRNAAPAVTARQNRYFIAKTDAGIH
ncbi:MAG: hypothetical protein JWO55_90 [Candidatus Saccharibacteria bacterium]|nr:hypothetical protein [Candidatus Saccharibacteria bacterium]